MNWRSIWAIALGAACACSAFSEPDRYQWAAAICILITKAAEQRMRAERDVGI